MCRIRLTPTMDRILVAVMLLIVLTEWLLIDAYLLPFCWPCRNLFGVIIGLQLVMAVVLIISLIVWWPTLRKLEAEERERKQLEAAGKPLPDGKSPMCSPNWRMVFYIPTIILFLVFIVGLSLYAAIGPQSANYNDNRSGFSVNGLNGPVYIYREGNGIIHVEANTDADLAFGQGWAQAQDRLFQMEFQKRLGSGRLSEMVGNSTLSLDIYFRTLGLARAARTAEVNLASDVHEVFTAFVAGINAYIATNPPTSTDFKILGVSPSEWTIADAITWGKVISLQLSTNIGDEQFRFDLMTEDNYTESEAMDMSPAYDASWPTILLDSELPSFVTKKRHATFDDNGQPSPTKRAFEFAKNRKQATYEQGDSSKIFQQMRTKAGRDAILEKLPRTVRGVLKHLPPFDTFKEHSNNWVIHGNLTASGKPILANDPHLGITTPSIWILMHLKSANTDVIGASFPGFPGLLSGHNERIAWGVTNGGTDVQDLYLMDEVDYNSYNHNGSVLNYTIINEEIIIRDASPKILPVRKSVYGPVLIDSTAKHPSICLKWVSLDDDDATVTSFWRILKAQNWNQFRDALSYFKAPAQNFVYADVDGNIGYQLSGYIPIRAAGHTGATPVMGDGSHDWQGYVPFDHTPHTLNPARGYIATANEKVTSDNYPYLIQVDRDFAPAYRGMRIRQLIEGFGRPIVPSDMRTIHGDWKSLYFQDLRSGFAKMNALSTASDAWRNKLLEWDGFLTRESTEATLYGTWLRLFSAAVTKGANVTVTDRLNAVLLRDALNNGHRFCGGSCETQHAQAFEDAIIELGLTADTNRGVKYGDVHHFSIQSQVFEGTLVECFFAREVPIGGDPFTVSPASSGDGYIFRVTHGPSYRHIIDLSNFENSLFIHPMGQSEVTTNPFYDNYLDAWAVRCGFFKNVRYVAMKTQNYDKAYTTTLNP